MVDEVMEYVSRLGNKTFVNSKLLIKKVSLPSQEAIWVLAS